MPRATSGCTSPREPMARASIRMGICTVWSCLTASEQQPAADALVLALVPAVERLVPHRNEPAWGRERDDAPTEVERMVLDDQTVDEGERFSASLKDLDLEPLDVDLQEIDAADTEPAHHPVER